MSQNQIIAVVARSSSLSPSSVGLSPVEAVRKRLHSRHSRHLRSSRLHSRSSPNAAAGVDLGVEVHGDEKPDLSMLFALLPTGGANALRPVRPSGHCALRLIAHHRVCIKVERS